MAGTVIAGNVTINGRQFRMACEDGQEEHLRSLPRPRRADQRVRSKFGEIGDARLTRDGGADGGRRIVGNRKRKLQQLEAETCRLAGARVAAADRTQATQAAVVGGVQAAAERIESMARRLNSDKRASGGNADGLAQG